MSTEFQLEAVRPIHHVQISNCLHKEEVLELNDHKASKKALIQLTLVLFICLSYFFLLDSFVKIYLLLHEDSIATVDYEI